MTTTDAVTAGRKPFRMNGWHVLAAITAFFGVVVAVDASFAVLAVRTFPGEVSVTPYEDGLYYNRHLAQMRAQAKLGWRAAATVSKGGELRVELRDRAGRPLTDLKVTAQLQRPATESGRLYVTLKPTGPGSYAVRPPAAPGAWDVDVVAVDAKGGRLEAQRRLTWR
jgi:nitrogen fixation protein FixH